VKRLLAVSVLCIVLNSAFIIALQNTPSKPPSPTPPKAGQEPKEQPDPTRKNTSRDNGPSSPAQPPIAADNPPSPPNTTEKPRNEPTGENNKTPTDWSFYNAIVNTILSAILVVVTIGLWLVGRRQASIVEQQNRIMGTQSDIMDRQLRATEDAAIAARDSATAAADSARTADLGLKSVEGAYLTAGEWKLESFGANLCPTIIFKIINIGRTPARIVFLAYNCGLFETIPNEASYEDMVIEDPTRFAQITPNSIATQYTTFNDALTDDQVARINEGKLFLLAWGRLEYRDIFGIVHTKRFGMYWSAKRNRFMYPHASGYNTDEENA
jgi:hypothetical protein